MSERKLNIEQILHPDDTSDHVVYRTVPIIGSEFGAVKHLYGIPYGQNQFFKGDYFKIENLARSYYNYKSIPLFKTEVDDLSEHPYIIVDPERVNTDDDHWIIYNEGAILREGRFIGVFVDDIVHGNPFINDPEDGDLFIMMEQVDHTWTQNLYYWEGDNYEIINELDGWFNDFICVSLVDRRSGNGRILYEPVDVEIDLNLTPKLIGGTSNSFGIVPQCLKDGFPDDSEIFDTTGTINFVKIEFENLFTKYPDAKRLSVENDSLLCDSSQRINPYNNIGSIVGKMNLGMIEATKNIYMIRASEILEVYPLFHFYIFTDSTVTRAHDSSRISFSSVYKTGNEILLLGPTIGVSQRETLPQSKISGSLNACRTILNLNKTEIPTSVVDLRDEVNRIYKAIFLGEYRVLSKALYITASSTGGTVITTPSYSTLDKSQLNIFNNVCFKCQQIDKIQMMMNQSDQILTIPQEQSVELVLIDEFGRTLPREIYTDAGKIAYSQSLVYLRFL